MGALLTARPVAPIDAMHDDHGVRVPERSLQLVRDLVHAYAGLYYSEDRSLILQDRLTALAAERGFDSLLDYYYLLKYDQDADREWARVIDALSVQETYFWREADQLNALAETIVPRLAALGRPRIRIWSVPCASGEEPLSIAMALTEAGCFGMASIEIHASDASGAALQRARQRSYGARSFRQLPDELREKYFNVCTPGTWTVADNIFSRVTSWSNVNLANPAQALRLSDCDVVFCRNLVIYFTADGIRQVIDGFADRMPTPGYLFVGASESLLRLTTRFELQDVAGAYVYVKS